MVEVFHLLLLIVICSITLSTGIVNSPDDAIVSYDTTDAELNQITTNSSIRPVPHRFFIQITELLEKNPVFFASDDNSNATTVMNVYRLAEENVNRTQPEVSFSIWSIVIASVFLGVLTACNLFVHRFTRTSSLAEDDMSCKVSLIDQSKNSAMRKISKRGYSSKWAKYSSRLAKKSKNLEKEEDNSECENVNDTVASWDEVATVMSSVEALPLRGLDKRIQMPMNEEEFIVAMKKVIEFIIEYYRNPAKYPVSTDIHPNDIFNQLPQKAPENPERFDLVWSDFNEIIMKGCTHWQHPRFHAFFPTGRSYPDILAETVISSLGTAGFTWAANPAMTELDAAMVNWLGRALGIPETFLFNGTDNCQSEGGGWLAHTASDAIFCAVMAARHCKVEQELAKLEQHKSGKKSKRNQGWKDRTRNEIISKLVAYGSYESHSSYEKACKMACVQCRHIEVYAEDNWGMRRETVEREMEKDILNGLIPFYLHVALGTTSTGSSDHLSELAPLGEKHNVWIHIDAAYAGSAWVVEKYRNNDGIDKVDSINANLHKIFLLSASVTPFWTRRQRDYKEFFHVAPAYLKKKTGGNDLRDWGVQLSRRFKSLKVFMLLRIYGLNGMRAYVTRMIEMTEYMETLVVPIPNIRKFGQTNYGVFCIQYYEDRMSEDQVNIATNSLCEFINNSHKLVFTHSNVRGHDIIRVLVALERSTKKDVEESVDIFIQLLNEFRNMRKGEDNNLTIDDMTMP